MKIVEENNVKDGSSSIKNRIINKKKKTSRRLKVNAHFWLLILKLKSYSIEHKKILTLQMETHEQISNRQWNSQKRNVYDVTITFYSFTRISIFENTHTHWNY